MLESLVGTVPAIIATFADCFTKPGFSNFATLMTGWVLCHGRHSISRVIQAAGQSATRETPLDLLSFSQPGKLVGG